MDVLPAELLDVLVKRVNQKLIGDDIVAWALHAVESGIESPSLFTLAGLPMRISCADTEPYFERTLEELHVEIPETETLLYLYLLETAKGIAAGTIDVYKGLDQIHKHVINPLEHPEELRGFCNMWEGNHPEGFDVVSDLDFEPFVRDYCQRFLENLPAKISHSKPSQAP